MCKKTNELIRNQQRPAQSQYGILESFMINSILMILYSLEAMLTGRLRRISTSKKKIHRYRNIELWRVLLQNYVNLSGKQIIPGLCSNVWLRFYFGSKIYSQSKLEVIIDSSTFCISVVKDKSLRHN